MPPVDDPQWAALGRELERLTRRAGTTDERITQLQDLVGQLAGDVATLALHVAGPGALDDQDPPERSWLLVDDPDLAQSYLTDLITWLNRVYLRYPNAVLPSCWLWHPAAIEELWALRCTHREAYDPRTGSWPKAADWHDRLRPSVAKRLTAAYGSCELALHLTDGSHTDPPATAPLTTAAQHIATTWTTTPDTPPIPTTEQLTEADQHDRASHRSNTKSRRAS